MLRSALFPLICAGLLAQAPDPLAPVRALAGEWVGEASGQPGQGAGTFSFRPELDGKVMVRYNLTTFPAKDGRPAIRHEDRLTVFSGGGQLKALYLDNEGHIIRYVVTALEGGAGLVFQSEPQPGPAFRLTYRMQGKDAVTVGFAIAPPGSTTFTTHVEGLCVRKGGA